MVNESYCPLYTSTAYNYKLQNLQKDMTKMNLLTCWLWFVKNILWFLTNNTWLDKIPIVNFLPSNVKIISLDTDKHTFYIANTNLHCMISNSTSTNNTSSSKSKK